MQFSKKKKKRKHGLFFYDNEILFKKAEGSKQNPQEKKNRNQTELQSKRPEEK